MGTYSIRFNLKNKGKGTFYYIEILSFLVKVWSMCHKRSSISLGSHSDQPCQGSTLTVVLESETPNLSYWTSCFCMLAVRRTP